MMPCDPDIVTILVTSAMVMLTILILPLFAGLPGQKVWVTHRKYPILAERPEHLFPPSIRIKKRQSDPTVFLHDLYPEGIDRQSRIPQSRQLKFVIHGPKRPTTIPRRKCTWRA